MPRLSLLLTDSGLADKIPEHNFLWRADPQAAQYPTELSGA